MSSVLSYPETETPQERPARHGRNCGSSLSGPITFATASLCAVVGITPLYLEQYLSQNMTIVLGGVWIVSFAIWMCALIGFIRDEVLREFGDLYISLVALLAIILVVVFVKVTEFGIMLFVVFTPLLVTLTPWIAHAILIVIANNSHQ